MDSFKQLHPSWPSKSFDSLSEILERHGKTVMDVLAHDTNGGLLQLAQTVGRSLRELKDYVTHLKHDLTSPMQHITTASFISTGLPTLDRDLGGGIPLGEVTEIFGAAGCGKSQLVSQLAARAQDIGKCVYITTESFLETKRLEDFVNHRKQENPSVSLDNISYVFCGDLETLDHILFTQLPIQLVKENVKLVLIDSIAQHLRGNESLSNAQYLKEQLSSYEEIDPEVRKQRYQILSSSNNFRNRSSKHQYICLLYRQLTRLASRVNVAIVLVNQITDFTRDSSEIRYEPLSQDFQTAINAGWDTFTTKDTFLSSEYGVQYHELNSRFLINNPLTGSSLISDSLESLQYDPRKKRRVDTTEYRSDVIQNGLLSEDSLRTQANNIKFLTKKQLPSLGYIWSKRVQNRVMLMKFYRPIIENNDEQSLEPVDPETGLTYSKLCEGFTLTESTEENGFGKDSKKSTFLNWSVERFARVVCSSHSFEHGSTGINSKIKFKIGRGEISEVTSDTNSS